MSQTGVFSRSGMLVFLNRSEEVICAEPVLNYVPFFEVFFLLFFPAHSSPYGHRRSCSERPRFPPQSFRGTSCKQPHCALIACKEFLQRNTYYLLTCVHRRCFVVLATRLTVQGGGASFIRTIC